MILRKGALNPIDCCGLLRWEQRARQSARDSAETEGSTQPVAAVSLNLNLAAEENRELKRAEQPGPSRTSKRSTTPDAEATSSKKQKIDIPPVIATAKSTTKKKQKLVQRIKEHGGPNQPPLSISTSDFDYSSEVEIVD
jgi:hypothetical protein